MKNTPLKVHPTQAARIHRAHLATSILSLVFLLMTFHLFMAAAPTTTAETFSTTDTHVTFTDVSTEAGFEGVGMANCAWGDVDNDGDDDLLLNGFRLFRNNGPPDWDFTDVSDEAGLTGSYSGVFGDYDNDGFLDLFQVTSNPDNEDKLWHNNGDGTFTDVTDESGIVDNYNTPAAGWGDYDADGFIDLYVANYEGAGSGGSGASDEPLPDFLWHNNGDGTFTDVSDEAGIRDEPDHTSRGVAWSDYDNDGDLDVYISNYRLHPNVLFENQGDGSFVNVADEKGVQGVARTDSEGTTRYGHTIGSAWGDMDNDGDFDLFVANLVHKDVERGRYCDDSKMYENLGPSDDYRFEDLRPGNGMPHKDYMGGEDELWSDCTWGDVDNDGFLDLFVTSVYTDIDYAHTYLYMNNGDNTFTDIALGAGVRVWASWGTSMCDYDQDGDLDIVVGGKDGVDASNNPSRLRLFRNDGTPHHSWLKLEVKGCEDKAAGVTNRAAIGARVVVTTEDGASQMREVEGGKGTCANQNSLELEFGFGRETRPVDIELRFPNGEVSTFKNVKLNQKLVITEQSGGRNAKLSGVHAGGSGDDDEDYEFVVYALAAGVVGVSVLLLLTGFRLDEKGDYRDEDGVLYGPPKTLILLACVLLVTAVAGAGVYKVFIYEEDEKGSGGSGGSDTKLPPPPPDYEAMAGEMGLRTGQISDIQDTGGLTGEDDSDTISFSTDSDNIAFLRFTLQWQDELDLAPPNPTGDNVVKNMGDTFSLLVETPWNVSFESPGPNNYHSRDGELVFTVWTSTLPDYSFLNYPDAPTSGEFTVHIQCLDCGDQREFGNFGPEPSDLFTEDDSNNWDLTVGYTVWEEG